MGEPISNKDQMQGNTKYQTSDFDYNLPEELIAAIPAEKRDEARLLLYNYGTVSHHKFYDLLEYLPENAVLVFNNTRVIPARIEFFKDSGGRIELFCLEPAEDDIQEAFSKTGCVKWKCLVGNLRKWKPEQVLTKRFDYGSVSHEVKVSLNQKRDSHCTVTFRWEPAEITWASLLERIGDTPLPPYIQRKAEPADKDRYQTVYARHEGAVAAPTAGLHFTEALLDKIEKNGVSHTSVTLHTGLGTFRPVSAENPRDHNIHRELVSVKKETVQFFKEHAKNLVMVGTTSLRAAESLYWTGVYLLENKTLPLPFELEPEYVWERQSSETPVVQDAMDALLNYMEKQRLKEIQIHTGLYILPGYRFHLTKGLITNFHLPKSTLLMLVAAFIGKDWEVVYNEALKSNYRFLSYGDSSLLLS